MIAVIISARFTFFRDVDASENVRLDTQHSSSAKTLPLHKCLDPPRDDCTFYTDCIESAYSCGPRGYPISQGLRYCTRFQSYRARLSPAGQDWMLDTMRCLQEALIPFLYEDRTDCRTLEKIAFRSHSDCYLRTGVCRLSFHDMLAVVELIGPGTFLKSWNAFKTSLEVATGCLDW